MDEARCGRGCLKGGVGRQVQLASLVPTGIRGVTLAFGDLLQREEGVRERTRLRLYTVQLRATSNTGIFVHCEFGVSAIQMPGIVSGPWPMAGVPCFLALEGT